MEMSDENVFPFLQVPKRVGPVSTRSAIRRARLWSDVVKGARNYSLGH